MGGKTVEEAYDLVENTYADRLSGNEVVIYSSNEAREAGTEEVSVGQTEELSAEQAKETVKY